MDDRERKHLEELLSIHRRRLRELEKLAALYGSNTAPQIRIEIEDIQEKIAELQAQLDQLRGAVSSQPGQPPATVPSNNPSPIPTSRRNSIFISYSHSDRRWLDRLHVHLKPLERDKTIVRWDDTMIKPGTKWREEIDKALKAAKVAILLVSADFLASDFIAHNELPPLLKAAEEEGVVILPVIVGHCLFVQTQSLSQFQAVNQPSQPLSAMSKPRQSAILVKVAEAVLEAFAPNP